MFGLLLFIGIYLFVMFVSMLYSINAALILLIYIIGWLIMSVVYSDDPFTPTRFDIAKATFWPISVVKCLIRVFIECIRS